MVTNDMKILKKLKNKDQLNTEKDIMKCENMKRLFYTITKKHRKKRCIRNCFSG